MIRLTKELGELNLNIDKLLANRNTLHQPLIKSTVIVGTSKSSTLVASLQQVRDHADRLYRAFREVWTLGCHPSHEAMLFLDTPVSSKKKGYSLSPKRSTFRLVIRWKVANMSMLPSWHETTVTVSEKDEYTEALRLMYVCPSSTEPVLTKYVK